ncbi:hypothetical protein BRADI_4g29901v3 [Brachypodium distachyon]|uniref:Reverse transcriptase zinc-binding domain-containing protein n=1 Tax=Brachypodium distachyon TaxID=15368 RepID=A0A2K2CR81_BRADI|nr:hypothetical protein BRADI_4g29901v3 [Brachypodium distachyon]
MGAILLPAGTIHDIDKRCRAFFWTGDGRCPFCVRTETTSHMLLHCHSVQPIWSALQALHYDASSCESLEELLTARHPPDKVHSTVLLAIICNIWKRRNAMVFNNLIKLPHLVIERCSNDIALWSHKCGSSAPKALMNDWSIMLTHLARWL